MGGRWLSHLPPMLLYFYSCILCVLQSMLQKALHNTLYRALCILSCLNQDKTAVLGLG